jgi:hypothetical protein
MSKKQSTSKQIANFQNVNYRMGVDRNRPISAYIQVVKVDLEPSDKCYQFHNAYTGHHKNIVYEEEVVSGTRSLWSVIDQLFPYVWHFHDYNTSCVEILLFHNNYEQAHQLWQHGQRPDMLLNNAPYLLRDNWEWTPDLFGLTDGDRIEIRIAPSDDMYDKTDAEDDDWKRYETQFVFKKNRRPTQSDRRAPPDEPAHFDRDTRGQRRRNTHGNRQPRSSLYHVLSQLETINISSTLGARGDPPPSLSSQERERHLEELLERERRRNAELLRQNRMLEMELQEIRKSTRGTETH